MTQPTHIEEKLREEFKKECYLGEYLDPTLEDEPNKIADWWLEKFRTTLTQLVERDLEWAEKQKKGVYGTEGYADGLIDAYNEFINHKKEQI